MPIARTCDNCGARPPSAANFCPQCGRAIAGTGAPAGTQFASPASYTPKHLAERILISRGSLEGERKQVTVLFADAKGSMELIADRDPEDARGILDPLLELMMEAVHRYEGTVNQVMGDGIMALFGAPVAHEHHATRACYAALRIQESVKRYAEIVRESRGVNVQVRIGLNSGEVLVRTIGNDLHMDYTAVGQTTHLAARMEQLANSGSILVTRSTANLVEGYVDVRPIGPVPVKGLPEPVQVYEVTRALAVRTRLQAAASRGLTRFIGRDVEMQQLVSALDKANQGRGQLVAVSGEAGVGKSRLFWELTRSPRTRGWLLLQTAALSYDRMVAYAPVVDLLHDYFHIQAEDDARTAREKVSGKLLTLDESLLAELPVLLALLDVPLEDRKSRALDGLQRRDRARAALKRVLLRESRVQPVLCVVEDLHWIDSETQAVLDDLVESLPAGRIALLVNFRPEYDNVWIKKDCCTHVVLDPLPPQRVEEFVRELLGEGSALRSLTRRLVDHTDGNPFFLEESIRALVETKVLVGRPGAYRLEKRLDAIQVPASVQAVLAARVDRLPSDDKSLLETASVVGKEVPFVVLEAVAGLPPDDLRRGLDRLQAGEFLYEAALFP
ncbi:MAG TPA: adenylate/guanylate cyclase domain-containing protein, partial [Gaiellales bacterium]|nr:adenylate/guanylate cyclase domain-containing protein [Gaiellales bacterium]